MARSRSRGVDRSIVSATTPRGALNLENFIRRLKSAGMDFSEVDLARYDFDAFETLDDLLRHYAFKEGDPLCRRLLTPDESSERAEYESQYLQYLNYVKNSVDEGSEGGGASPRPDPMPELEHRMLMIDNKLSAIESRLEAMEGVSRALEALEELRRQLEGLRKSVEAVQEGREGLEKVRERLERVERRVEELSMPAKTVQARLFEAAQEARGEAPGGRATREAGSSGREGEGGIRGEAPGGRATREAGSSGRGEGKPPARARILCMIKTVVVSAAIMALAPYYQPLTPADAILAPVWVMLALLSDFIITLGVYSAIIGRARATPGGVLYSRGRRYGMRGTR